jgi:hypothetical protein
VTEDPRVHVLTIAGSDPASRLSGVPLDGGEESELSYVQSRGFEG